MTFCLGLAALACGVAHIVADHRRAWRLTYLFKPLTMVAIIAIAALPPGNYSALRVWVVAGLGLSLVGDILLMLRPARFVAGLVFFLRRDRALGLVSHGQRREVVQADRGERQLTKLLETLAVLRADGTVPFAELIRSEGQQLVRGTSVILITPSSDIQWLVAARQMERAGMRVVTVVIDSATFGGATEASAGTISSASPSNAASTWSSRSSASSRPAAPTCHSIPLIRASASTSCARMPARPPW